MIDLRLGDCIDEMRRLPDKSIDLCLTDPPYGTTACKWDNVIPFEPMWEQLHRVVKDNGAICLFGTNPFTANLIMSNPREYKYDWFWDKINGIRNHLNAKKQPMRKMEVVTVFYRKQSSYFPQMRKGSYRSRKTKPGQSDGFGRVTGVDYGREIKNLYPLDLLEFKSHDPNNSIHPTQKPVALLEYLIKTYTLEGETVLDFTMGSGSTGVACKNLNRNFIGIEKEPKYFEIAQKRIFKQRREVGHP